MLATALVVGGLASACRRPPVGGAEGWLAPGQAPRLSAEVEPGRLEVGQAVWWTWRLDHHGPTAATWPPSGELLGGLVVEDALQPPPEQRGPSWREVRRFRLRAERVGPWVLPAPSASVGQPPAAVHGPSLTVEVAAPAPGAGAEPGELDPLWPLSPPRPWWPWASGALGTAAAAVALARWRAHRRRRRAPGRPPQEPPERAAARRLAALSLPTELDAAAAAAYCTELSATLRAYVEGRYGLNATDLTTEEILARIDAVAAVSSDHLPDLREVLRETDPVKFAKSLPSAAALGALGERARRFVQATRPAAAGAAAAAPPRRGQQGSPR